MFFFFQAEDGIRDIGVTGVQTCALPILAERIAELLGSPELRERLRSGGRALAPRFAWATVAAGILGSQEDRKRVVLGKSVDLGGRRIIKKKKNRKLKDEG